MQWAEAVTNRKSPVDLAQHLHVFVMADMNIFCDYVTAAVKRQAACGKKKAFVALRERELTKQST
jgi:hypothetical protein